MSIAQRDVIERAGCREVDHSDYSESEAMDIAQAEFADETAQSVQKFYRIEPTWSLSQLLTSDVQETWLIENMLVMDQPCLIAGASKGMKTTIAILLALCMASGRALFHFNTRERKRVHIASAESGKATIKKTVIALAEAMGIDLQELADGNWLSFDWFVPRASDAEFMAYYQKCLKDSGAEVAVFDPLYLSIENKQSSQEENGQQLNQLVKTIMEAHCLPIIVDHTKLSSENVKQFQPLQLSDLSGAGKSNFFRQWLLLGRRERFEPAVDGVQNHRLWLTVGGSAGHAGQWALDIEETNTSITERQYSLKLESFSEVIEQQRNQRDNDQQDKSAKKAEALEQRMQRKADELIKNVYAQDYTMALTQSDIEGRLSVSGTEIKRVLGIVLTDKRLKLVAGSITKNGRKFDGYMLGDSLEVGQ